MVGDDKDQLDEAVLNSILIIGKEFGLCPHCIANGVLEYLEDNRLLITKQKLDS